MDWFFRKSFGIHGVWLNIGVRASVVTILLCQVIISSTGNERPYSYVTNTRPPDAFLSLRSHPSAVAGTQLEEMPNGTLLEVLSKRSDGWWFVRNASTGRTGWALSRYGGRTWIECCRLPNTIVDSKENLYEPKQGSWERTAILNAVRVRMEQDIEFKVNFIRVINSTDYSIANAELEDASGTLPLGLFFLQTNGSSWRVRYSIGVQGLGACSDIVSAFEELLNRAKRLKAPKEFFSNKFYQDYTEVRTSSFENCAGFDVRNYE